eukprot:g14161.t1
MNQRKQGSNSASGSIDNPQNQRVERGDRDHAGGAHPRQPPVRSHGANLDFFLSKGYNPPPLPTTPRFVAHDSTPVLNHRGIGNGDNVPAITKSGVVTSLKKNVFAEQSWVGSGQTPPPPFPGKTKNKKTLAPQAKAGCPDAVSQNGAADGKRDRGNPQPAVSDQNAEENYQRAMARDLSVFGAPQLPQGYYELDEEASRKQQENRHVPVPGRGLDSQTSLFAQMTSQEAQQGKGVISGAAQPAWSGSLEDFPAPESATTPAAQQGNPDPTTNALQQILDLAQVQLCALQRQVSERAAAQSQPLIPPIPNGAPGQIFSGLAMGPPLSSQTDGGSFFVPTPAAAAPTSAGAGGFCSQQACSSPQLSQGCQNLNQLQAQLLLQQLQQMQNQQNQSCSGLNMMNSGSSSSPTTREQLTRTTSRTTHYVFEGSSGAGGENFKLQKTQLVSQTPPPHRGSVSGVEVPVSDAPVISDAHFDAEAAIAWHRKHWEESVAACHRSLGVDVNDPDSIVSSTRATSGSSFQFLPAVMPKKEDVMSGIQSGLLSLNRR